MPFEGDSELERQDVEAILEVRRELGPSYDGGIPITAIAGIWGHLPGIVIVWVGIVLVNLAHALTARPRP